MRDGNKKTVFANVADICKRMHRQPEHVIQFLFAELGTSGSIDGSQRLVIKGRFQQKQIEAVLRRYIVEYVTCKTCKSPDTILTKENRLFFLQCEACGSTRSVSAIKSGFQAQTGKRAAQRVKAAAVSLFSGFAVDILVRCLTFILFRCTNPTCGFYLFICTVNARIQNGAEVEERRRVVSINHAFISHSVCFLSLLLPHPSSMDAYNCCEAFRVWRL